MPAPTEIYENRVNALHSLMMGSDTDQKTQLINHAIEFTHTALEYFLKVSELSMTHLKISESRKSELNERFGEFLKNFRSGKEGLSNTAIGLETRQKMAEALDLLLTDTRASYEVNFKAAKEEQETFQWCYEHLDKTLFREIFVSEPGDFPVEDIIEDLKALIQRLHPYSEDLTPVLEMNIIKSHNQLTDKEDQIRLYLENYIMVLGVWIRLAEAYRGYVVNDDTPETPNN